jgi:hypothetical protein
MTENRDLSESETVVLAECQSEHGDEVYFIARASSFVVFRAPTRAEIQRFKATVLDEKKNAAARANADWELCKSVVLFPKGADREKLFDKRPMLQTDVAGDALAVASDSELKSAKKFESAS